MVLDGANVDRRVGSALRTILGNYKEKPIVSNDPKNCDLSEPEVKPQQFPDERTFALWIAYSFVLRTEGLNKVNVDDCIKKIGSYRDKLVSPPPKPSAP